MKKIIFLFLIISTSSFSQESKEPKFDFSVSYGLSYIDYAHYSEKPLLNFDLPTIGTFYEFNLDYKLPKNRYIGVGFSRQQHSKNTDDGILLESTNTGFILDNYYNTYAKNFYDVHFRRVFKNNIHFTLGLFFFVEKTNEAGLASDDTNLYIVLDSPKNRSDHFGFFSSLEYYFKLNSYAELGLKGKLYYSLNGIETINLLPTLRVKL